MAEFVAVLGIISSIGQVIDGTTKLIGWIDETKNASKDAREFRQDAVEIQSLVTRLRYRLKDSDTPVAWLKSAIQLEPLVNELNASLDDFSRRVQPVKGIAKLNRHFLWSLKKQDIKDVLGRIERLKTLIGLALSDKLWELTSAIEADTRAIRTDTGDIKRDTKVTKDKVQQISSGVEELQIQARRQRHQAIVDFIAPYDFAQKHGSVLSQRQPGTGQWFLDAPEYQRWINSEPHKGNTLWCPGIPGAGKTTMVSIVVDDLQKRFRSDEETAVAFLYCDYREREIQTLQNMVASLWRHLVQTRLMAQEECAKLENNYVKRNQRPQVSDLLKFLFEEMHKYHRKVYVVIDALDESSRLHGMQLLSELRESQPLVRILVTSRFVIDADSALYDTTEQLRIRASTADLQEYIDRRIESEAKLSSTVRKDPSLGRAIADTVAEKAQGM